MKNRRILCMTALMLAMLLAMGGCKQAEAKEASTQPVEHVEETEETTEKPTIGESTEEELKAEAEAKAKAEAEAAAKAEAEKKAAEEAAAKAEAEKKAAEELKAKEAAEAAAKAEAEKKAAEEAAAKAATEKKTAEEAAAKKEQESQQSQSSKPDSSQSQTSKPDSSTQESKPNTSTSNSSSGGYTLNEYGNPVDEMAVRKGLVDTINVSDPRFNKVCGLSGYRGSTPIPNPFAKVEPISPFRGMENPPADWPNPGKYTTDAGVYKWDSETGCWRYYIVWEDGREEATRWYISLYGYKTTRSSEMKKSVGSTTYKDAAACTRGVY